LLEGHDGDTKIGVFSEGDKLMTQQREMVWSNTGKSFPGRDHIRRQDAASQCSQVIVGILECAAAGH
jgi:hypothetical protein